MPTHSISPKKINKRKALFIYLLRLADSNLILSHRLQELCGHGPEMEEDLALANVALDLLGQARFYYQYISSQNWQKKWKDENEFAFHRNEQEYYNYSLCEQPNGDYAHIMLRQFFYDVFHYHLLKALTKSCNHFLKEISLKAIKEVTYHRRRSSHWVEIFSLGTTESKNRLQQACDKLWHFTQEFFYTDPIENFLIEEGIIPKLSTLKKIWKEEVCGLLNKGKITYAPNLEEENKTIFSQGKLGEHTEHLGHLLALMQYLPRSHKNVKW